MGAGKILVFSLVVGCLAVFCTLDKFQNYRSMILEHLPRCIKSRISSSSTSGSETSPENVIVHWKTRILTKEELSEYDGVTKNIIYLGILGRVYEVTTAPQYYGPGGGYSFFAGKDGTKAFMTGEFNAEGLIDDVSGLTSAQMLELENWIQFYEGHYTFVGKVTGNFYNADGEPTQALLEAKEKLDLAHKERLDRQEERRMFPPCNSETSQGARRVWCTTRSGGINRDWVGVPRRYYKPGQTNPLCVCVRTSGPPSLGQDMDSDNGDLDNPNMKEYKGCEPDAKSCPILD